MNQFETFSQLHRQTTPLLLGNIWDVHSAKIFEASGYKAIGTSSMAVAKSWGYEDGEKIPFELLLRLAKKVVSSVNIPFSVDLEAGYSRAIDGILENITQLHEAGVAGINLEDTGGTRQLQPVGEFEKIISAVAEHVSRKNLKLFLNIRTDAFLLGMPTALAETLQRIKTYEKSGADGIFVPCITQSSDIKEIVQATTLPVNVMLISGLPGFDELTSLGVKRISMGPFMFNKVYENLELLSKKISSDKTFSSILA
jgi:2-methylisocitrate lyase-like PEP mutase family enzyme